MQALLVWADMNWSSDMAQGTAASAASTRGGSPQEHLHPRGASFLVRDARCLLPQLAAGHTPNVAGLAAEKVTLGRERDQRTQLPAKVTKVKHGPGPPQGHLLLDQLDSSCQLPALRPQAASATTPRHQSSECLPWLVNC